MPYIWYPILFQKNEVQALINSNSKINVITLVYAEKLGFIIWKISVRAQKIDSLLLKIYGIASAKFSI